MNHYKHYIIRTRKFSKINVPYLKITSLSTKKNEKKEQCFKLVQTQNDLNYNLLKNNNNNNNYSNDNEKVKEKKFKNINLNNKLKALISNNITIVSQKTNMPINEKKIKIMKDDETNTDPITEIINISPSETLNHNINNNHILDLKKGQINNSTNKVIALKKNLKSSPNYSPLVNFTNNQLNIKIPRKMNINNIKNKNYFTVNNTRVFSSHFNNQKNINYEDKKNENFVKE